MTTIFMLIVFVLAGIAAIIARRKIADDIVKNNESLDVGNIGNRDHERKDRELKTQMVTALIVAIASGVLFGSCFICSGTYSIDEGEGVILTQFGKIYDQVTDPGLSFKRPWASKVTWRVRLKSMDEQIEARSKDEMKTIVDITIWWKVQPDKLDTLYSSIAKDYDTLQNGFVIPGIRSAVRDEVAKVSYEKLNSNREKYAKEITKYVASQLSKKYVIIDKINIRKITPPGQVNDAIEEKLKMDQKVKKAELEVELAKKEAQVKIEQAKGIAKSQKIIQQKLTPLYVQWYAIEMQKKLAGSPNTTFYFVPMSKNSGIPMIYGAPK